MASSKNPLPWPVVVTALIQSVIFVVLVLGWDWPCCEAMIIVSLGNIFMIGIVVAVVYGWAESDECRLMWRSLMDTLKRDWACVLRFLRGRR